MKNNKKLLIIVSVAIVFLFSIIIAIILNQEKEITYPAQTTIDNISDYFPNMSKNIKNKIFYYLYNNIQNNLDDSTHTPPESGALVRDGSATGDSNTGSFIVDIESVQQNYRVRFSPTQPDEEENIFFSCLLYSESIYKNSYCDVRGVDDVSVYTIWENDYLIKYIIDSYEATLVEEVADDFILSPQEQISISKDRENMDMIVVEVNEQSYTNYSKTPFLTYSIDASTDDGRDYRIYIHTNNDNTLAVYITRTDIENHSTATIFSKIKNVSESENWIHSFSSSVEINHKDF